MKKIEERVKNEQQKAPEMKVMAKPDVLSSKNCFATFVPYYPDPITKRFYTFNKGAAIDQPSSFFHPPGDNRNSNGENFLY
jgi:hypothetical protein